MKRFAKLAAVENIDSRVRTIRVKGPKNGHVQVRGALPTTRLAPGLEFSFEVVFTPPKEVQFKDKVTLRTESETVAIPITIACPRPDLRLHGDLDFGAMPHEATSKLSMRISNDGGREGTFQFYFADDAQIEIQEGFPLKISPMKGSVSAHGSADICASIFGQEIGSITGEVAFHLEGKDVKRIVAAAAVMKQSFQVVDSHGAEVKEVDFGTLYYGEESSAGLRIINNGPREMRCTVSFGNKFAMAEEEQEMVADVCFQVDPFASFIQAARMKAQANETGENPFSVNPLSIVVPPFKDGNIVVQFHPSGLTTTKGFTANVGKMGIQVKRYDFVGQIEFGGVAEKMRFQMIGRGVESSASLKQNCLNYGIVPTYDHADQPLEISNAKCDLPIRFKFPKKSPYFQCDPPDGVIPPGQTTMLIVRYYPKSLGNHSSTIPIQICSLSGMPLKKLRLRVVGVSVEVGKKQELVQGTDKLPEDFKRAPKFVDEEQASSVARKLPFKRPKLWEDKENNRLFSDIGDGTVHGLSLDDYKRQKRHKEQYDNFIQERRLAKEKGHLNAREKENDVNLGMEPRSGLESPKLTRVHQTDPLWTKEDEEEKYPKTLKSITAEQAAAIRLFKDKAESEEERRACSSPLSNSDMAKLGVGPLTVDFGRVSKSARHTQYFVVNNALSAPIHIVLDIKRFQEFKYTRNTSQVVPPGAMAKFPIVLFSKEVMAVSKKIDYIINGRHFLAFDVDATVAAASVDLSEREIIFEFEMDNWEHFVDQTLIMDNPNPFSTVYEWECNCDEFYIDPKSGTIGPNSSQTTCVRWTPDADAPPESHDGVMILSLQGGSEGSKKVRLRGELPEVSVKFKEHAMDVGPVACSVPQSVGVEIKNTGANDAAFRGLVAPEDSFTLEVAFTCAEEGKFVALLEIELRNHQILKLPISALAVVPCVDVVEPGFDFGAVHIGGLSRLPLTVKNTTPVAATILLDFSALTDFEMAIPKDSWSTEEYETCPLKRAHMDSDSFSVCSARFSKR
ncbi:unnamed protein product [Ostreobium quekettii]|uniref:Uncharacterized protein n=1 Tax=Ostreobium quekettii TaxID=121088 RepID=A0A8S1IK19_9CHLO|nr:unnamed protein product [Ostreobium quekettii]